MSQRPESPPEDGTPAGQRSFGATMIAIFWSFIGLRRKSDFDRDAAGAMNPVFVIIAGLIGTLLFIGALVVAVKFAVA